MSRDKVTFLERMEAEKTGAEGKSAKRGSRMKQGRETTQEERLAIVKD